MAAAAAAQAIPSEPISLGSGRVVFGGDVSAALAPEDPGFFSYGVYEHSTLRQLRLALTAQVRATRHLSVLAEVRSENLDELTPTALYVRLRPFADRRLDIQAGRIPPTFGRFSRLVYARQNPLIGVPLAYQYLTSLRPDSLPADTSELVQMRARGWLLNYSVGDSVQRPGVPLIATATWDTGVQVTTGWRILGVTGALTNGTLSNPRVRDDNGGKQVAARVTVAPAPGLEIGSSFARGAFVGRQVLEAADIGDPRTFAQTAYGLDAEYGIGHSVTRAEVVYSAWEIPLAASRLRQRLNATAISAETRYALLPGLYVALRAEHLGFNEVTRPSGTLPWDAPVVRVEFGAGYSLQRNLQVRGSLQLNERDAGRTTSARLPAVQLLYWF